MRIHMMAVAGTGMGALAGLLKAQGHEVTGCDTALYPPMSEAIARYGIPVDTGHEPSHLTAHDPEMVIIGNAIHADNPEAEAVVGGGIPYLSMAEAIRRFTLEGRKGLVVAGTHGKTTTTALCGWLLEECGLGPNVLVGGIVKNWDASFRWGGGDWTVLEGDEYETAFFDKGPKFLHYEPSLLILNNIEMDHLDNFADLEALEGAFVRLFGVVKEDGLVLAGVESPSVSRLLPFLGRSKATFGIGGGEDWSVSEVVYEEAGTRFRLLHKRNGVGEFRSPLYGAHNLRNTVAALAACLEAGAETAALQAALAAFPGVRRRQEILHLGPRWVVVDDFAHHPTAILETLKSLRQRFPGRPITACYEPRSFTCQTSLHQETLPAALAMADRCFIGPVKVSSKIPEGRRLDVAAVARALEASGKEAGVLATLGAYEEAFLDGDLPPRGLVAFFSSGAFGGIPARLARRLGEHEGGAGGGGA